MQSFLEAVTNLEDVATSCDKHTWLAEADACSSLPWPGRPLVTCPEI